MNVNILHRRGFLRKTTGLVGAAALAPEINVLHGMAAAATAAKSKEELDKVFTDMEADGRAYLCVPRKDGQFLNMLVKAVRAQNVLELGTSLGSAAIWLSLALEETGGKLTSVEILADRVQQAKANVAKAGLSHRVTFKQGDAHEIITTLEGPFDFILLHADKEGQVDYFKKLYPKKLSPGGLLLSQNAIKLREKMQDYLDLVTKHPDFDTVILSPTMDDGFSVSYRHKK